MIRPSGPRLAQVCIGVLLLVIVRSLSEFFPASIPAWVGARHRTGHPLRRWSLFATVVLALTVICYFASLYRTSMALTSTTLILLLVYKVALVN